MTVLHLDLETRSAVDLKKTGVYRYAEDPSTDVWCAAYAVDDGPVGLWTPQDGPVEKFDPDWTFVAHNANFERAIWHYILTPRYGWPEPKLEHWRCTMAQALAMSLPASLENAAGALGVDIGKDMTGRALMMRMAKPRSQYDDGTYTWWDDQERRERLYAYCKTDVEVERAIGKRLLSLRPQEQELWFLDQRINDRGAHVDSKLCEAAKKIVTGTTAKLDNEMARVTDWSVTACSNVGQLTAYCRAQGIDADSVAKDQLALLLARDDLKPPVRRALELRQEAAKASVAKIDALLAGKSRDGRARGMLQFHAASTGRWGGRRFQPQNLLRTQEGVNVDELIEDVLHGKLDLIEMLHGAPLNVIGNCIRGMICAAPGNKLIAGDFANIEGRVLAWLADEKWKLDAFAAYDARTGPDLYTVAYGRSFGIAPADVTKPQRQFGKVEELALGFQGGPGAFNTMARGYGVDIGQSYELICDTAPEAAHKAHSSFESRGKRTGMKLESWVAAEIVKLLWRDAHPHITQFWWALQDAALEALDNPGEVVSCGKLRFRKAGSFMFLQLPSGRALVYPYPRRAMKEMPWDGEDGLPSYRSVFSYKGVDSYTRKWTDCYAYGGLWAENVTQAAARDVLAEALPRLEAAGYLVILHAHDEAVAEVPLAFGSVEEFCRIMAAKPQWITDCPIAAEGWAGNRYRKG